ncbi:hypothetical protein ONS95_004574 [Cadophora gregata]|uniref:uncharacterized protein n=1 Tax=Cadophora gregata TaxID=51156 RepID=UPI0026DB1B40|nr:uncharacterized protein ONS95_004574 [Cadophora gregata]KAK0106069.1 hypothetical protein ONS95_004574 [Cadophora gregata]
MDNIFVSLDALLYTLGISILLVIAYALNSRNAQSNYKKETIKPKSGTGDTVQHAKALEIYEDLRQSPSWWSDEKLFEVEKRAIFSKTWLFVTHASRFQKPGDYRTFDIAGFSFIVILGKDKEIRAFHNVCRHRAYAVTKKESGSSTVLGCRYHGWSYDTRGKLVKAPEFDKVPGFDKETNGLWEIKTSIVLSMVYVNFDASTHVDSFDLHGSEVLLRKWSVSKMKCLEEWKTEGAFNWKLLGTLSPQEEKKQKRWYVILPGLGAGSRVDLELGHTTIMRRIGPNIILILKAVPKSAKSTTLECSIYANDHLTTIDMDSLRSELNWEIKQLTARQQRIMRNEEPIMALASLVAKQGELNRLLGVHIAAEKNAGGEIYPAVREQSFSREGKVDDDFCRELENPGSTCNANAKGLLDW